MVSCNDIAAPLMTAISAPTPAGVSTVAVLSPGSGGHDHVRKLRLYEAAGVQEYWIVDGANRVVLVYLRAGDHFAPLESFNFDALAPVQAIPELSLDFAAVALELDREEA